MKLHILGAFLFIYLPLSGQVQQKLNSAHGPSVDLGYSSLYRYHVGIGYQFMHPDDNYGYWIRYQHRYYLEYLPAQKGLGIKGSFSYSLFLGNGGIDLSFHAKNNANKAYFTISPHVGVDLLYFNVTVGPEFISMPISNKSMGFLINAKINPYVFNSKASTFNLKKRLTK